jgi:hypothetical protein
MILSGLFVLTFWINVTYTQIKEIKKVENAKYTIANRRQLFVDSTLIERFDGEAQLKLHHPRREEVVMTFDRPWEGNVSLYGTIIKTQDGYRMYYRGWHIEGGPGGESAHDPVVCVAESPNGLEWKRTTVGLFEFNGSKDNNLVWTGEGAGAFVPFLDRNPDARPEARYKAVAKGQGPNGRVLRAFQSHDGLNWEKMQEKPILNHSSVSNKAFDSQNVAFWDAEREEYRVYFRDWVDGKVRGIKTATSDDFLNWTEPEWLKWGPEAPLEHLYTNAVQPYPRAPHLYIGFPARFRPDREDMLEPLLITSRDGQTFHRWEEALIRPGRNADRWFNRSNYIQTGIMITPSPLPGEDKELSILTNEDYYKGDDTRFRRYSWRLDGFASLHAPAEGGDVITKPLSFQGKHLHLNYSTAVDGHIRVEIQDERGHPIKGFSLDDMDPVYGNELDGVVEWNDKSNISELAGQTVRLRFELKDADIFAMHFGNVAE